MAKNGFAQRIQDALAEAASYDKEAERFLEQGKLDYVEAVCCHKSAQDLLEKVLSSVSLEEQHVMMLCSVQRPFLNALYSHLEYHINRQSELMTTDQNITKEMKRELYIKSVCERAAEHSSLPANNRTFERQFSDQEDLLNSLDERCSHAISDLQAEEGGQRYLQMKETIDKLKTKNAHCKQLLDGLVTEYAQLQEELRIAEGRECGQFIKEADQTETSVISRDELVHLHPRQGVRDDGIQFTPLETPPVFDIPDNLDL
ncbi:uncharacterized protein [Watersipora subatra]|uniref:uncharacterized protein n=1 Tax=Watersipora subatra TaxID=2589382 RepID=UPI00355B94D6